MILGTHKRLIYPLKIRLKLYQYNRDSSIRNVNKILIFFPIHVYIFEIRDLYIYTNNNY